MIFSSSEIRKYFFPLKAKKLSQFLLITSNAYHHAMTHFPGDHMAQVVWIYQLWGGSYMDFSGPIGRKVGKNHKKNCWGLDKFFTFSISYISKNLHFDALNFSLHSQMTERWHKCVVFGPVCSWLLARDACLETTRWFFEKLTKFWGKNSVFNPEKTHWKSKNWIFVYFRRSR